MKYRLTALPLLIAFVAGCASTAIPPTAQEDRARLPRGEDQLRWTVDEKVVGHRNMQTIFPSAQVSAGGRVFPLTQGKPLAVTYTAGGSQRTLDDFFARTTATGLIVVKNGQVVLERYARGYDDKSAGSSRSMAKTVLGTLVGIALRDGAIKSLDDHVDRYVPELAGTMWAKVSIRNLLTMTSGVPYREDPNDATSDLFPLQACTVKAQSGCFLQFARDLGSRSATPSQPGTVFNYSSADAVVEALVLERATGMSAAKYLSDRVWKPFGMQQDAYWNVEAPGSVVVGPSGVGATLRDYARFGVYLSRGGVLPDGTRSLPNNWADESRQATAASSNAKRPYGFNVWLPDADMPNAPGTFFGIGSSGQIMLVDPQSQLVIVKWASWDNGPVQRAMREEDWALFKAIQASLKN